MKTWTLEVEELPDGEQFISLPDDLIEETGWKSGDELKWIDNHDGSWTLEKKVEETELVMVECISTFRQRYVVEVPKGKSEWALDTVTMNEAKEFSQLHLGETIVSDRVITKEELIAISDIDNDYCKSWSEEQKLNAFVTWKKDYE